MTGRALRIAGSAAALAILVGGAIWWMLRGAAGAGPEADDGTTAHSAGAGPAAPDALYPPTLEAAGVIVQSLAVGSAEIEGTVRLGTKPTAARVLVYVTTSTPGDVAAVAGESAGDDGRFVIPRLPAGSYELLAQDAQGRRGGAIVTVALPGQRVGCEIRLREGTETLRGRVIDVGGRPWRGRVTALAQTAGIDLPAREYPSVETDAEGRFVLERLEPGRAAPHGWDATGLEWTTLEVDVPSPREIVIDLGAGTRELAGTVVDAGTGGPVAGALLVARAGRARGFDAILRRGVTGADGRFRIRVPSAAATLVAKASGYAPAWVDTRKTTQDLAIRLVRPGRITGRVLREPGGAMVTGVPVVAQRLDVRDELPYDATAYDLRGETDGTGTYAIEDVPPGVYLLSALGAGVCTREVSSVDGEDTSLFRVQVAPGLPATLDLKASAAGIVHGVVLDPEGAAVEGAIVSWEEANDGVVDGGHDRRVTSGRDGRFRFDAVYPAPAPIRLEASAAGFLGSACEPEESTVRPGETAQVTLRLGRGRHALVTVVDPDGKPIPGAWLSGWRHAVTGADGTARFPWHKGVDLRVYATAPGFRERSDLIEDDGREVPELRIELARGLALAGRVVGARGQPLAGAQVEIDGPGATLSVVADTEGRFRAWVAFVGPWSVLARADDTEWADVQEVTTRAPDEQITVVGVEKQIAGFPLRVIGPDGTPIPRVRLLVDPEAKPRYEETIPGEGARVDVGRRSVVLEVFDPRDHAGQPLPLAAARSERLSAGRTEPFELRLSPERAIEGRVVDATGHGLAGVRLEAVARVKDEDDNERELSPAHASELTDADGRFRIGGLWAGPYRVLVARGEGFSVPEPLLLDAPATDVRIDLRPSITSEMTILDADGRVVPNARVVARRLDDPSGTFASTAHADGEGVARLQRLDPTLRYGVTVEPPDTVQTALPTALADWSPGASTVPLPRAHVIAGRVLDEEGAPLPYAEVWLARGDKRIPATADAQGAFGVGRLVPGTYDVNATPAGRREQFPALWGKTSAPSGASEVTVTVPGKPIRVRMDDFDYADGGALVSVGLVEGSKVGPWRHGTLYRGKEVVFPCLDSANEYVVFVTPGPDGHGAVLGPVRPRSEPFALRAVRGRVVTGRAVFPSAEGEVKMVVAGTSGTLHLADGRKLTLTPAPGAPVWVGAYEPNSSFRIPGLPAGSFWVTVEARFRGETRRASALERGEPLEIPIGGK